MNNLLLEFQQGSCIEVAPNVVRRQIERFIYWHKVTLPDAYISNICRFHGGVPRHQCFKSPDGNIRVVGRFFNYLEEHELPSPCIPSWRGQHDDVRLDYSVWFVIEQITGNQTLVPFAGIDTEGRDCRDAADYFFMLAFTQDHEVVIDESRNDIKQVARSFEGFVKLLESCPDTVPIPKAKHW